MRLLAASSIGLVALAAAGCGGGGSSSFDAAKANGICRDARTKLEAIPHAATVSGVRPYLDEAVPVLEQQRADVAKLGGSDRPRVKTLLATWDDVLEAARRAEHASDDARIVLAMRATHRAKLRADAAAAAAGATGCKGFSPFEYSKH